MEVKPREQIFSCLNEFFNKIIVLLPIYPRMPVPQIQRVFAQPFIICADIKGYRQYFCRVNTGSSRVDHQLPDRDLRPVRPPVANAQDTFGISGHDKADMASVSSIFKACPDILRMVDIQIGCSLRLDEQLMVMFNILRNNRVIDYRHEFHQML